MTKYCQSCGQPTEFSLTPPKFCASCGTPFSNLSVASTVNTLKPTPRPPSTSPPSNPKISQLAQLRLKRGVKTEDLEDNLSADDDDFGPTELNLDNLSEENMGFEEDDIPKKHSSGIKIGQIAGSSKEPVKPIQSPKGKYNKKALLNEWKREASSSPPPRRKNEE